MEDVSSYANKLKEFTLIVQYPGISQYSIFPVEILLGSNVIGRLDIHRATKMDYVSHTLELVTV